MIIEHLLVSLHGRVYVYHCYMMCKKTNKRDYISGVSNKLFELAEKAEGDLFAPIVLITNLDTDGIAQVRKIIEQDPEVKAVLAKAKDTHFTCWAMPAGCSENERLMELH